MKDAPQDYRGAFDRAIARACLAASQSVSSLEAARRGHGLQERRPEHQVLLLENSSKYSRPEVVSELVQRSFACRHDNPTEMRRLALLAVEVSKRLPAEGPERAITIDAQAEAFSAVANAERVAGDHEEAELLWQMVEDLLAEGSGNPLLIAETAWLRGTLRVDQTRYREAIKLFTDAIDVYTECGDLHRAGRALTGLARAYRGEGNLNKAIDCLFEAARNLDPTEEPILQMAVTHNLAVYLDEAGFPLHAFRVLNERRFSPSNRHEQLLVLRSRWLEARITASLGLPSQATAVLRSVLGGFLREDMPFDAALAALELAIFYAEQGKVSEARRLAGEVYPIFQAREIPREAGMAMLVFFKTSTQETCTLEVLQDLRKKLQEKKAAAHQG